jgi:hypothetical protein
MTIGGILTELVGTVQALLASPCNLAVKMALQAEEIHQQYQLAG